MKKQMIIIVVLNLVLLESYINAMPAHLIRALATKKMKGKDVVVMATALSALSAIHYILSKNRESSVAKPKAKSTVQTLKIQSK